MFSHLPWLVFTFSCSSCACSANGLSALTLPGALPWPAPSLLLNDLIASWLGFPLFVDARRFLSLPAACWRASCCDVGGHFLSVCHRRFLFCVRLRLYSAISTVKAGTVSVHVLGERIIDVGVIDNGLIHARHSGVVLEVVSTPSSAPVAVSGVAITVINASIKADMRSPVTLVKRVCAVVPAPPSRCPKQTDLRWSDPDARDPVIIVVIGIPAPVAWSPDVTCNRARWLLIYRQRRRSKIDRYIYLGERRRERQCEKAS